MTLVSRFRQRVFQGPSSKFLWRITLLALVIRLVWNLVIHPPGQFVDSDMRSYWEHATWMLKDPYQRHPAAIFFPYGTASLLALIRRIFGATSHIAPSIVWALLGTSLVPMVHALSARLSRSTMLPRIAAIIACFYYPWISLGGYYLSELPYTVCVTASALFSLRLADRGQGRDAFLFGLAVAVGSTFRPQIVAALPLMLVLWFFRRPSLHGFRLANWIRLAVPIVLVASFSVARFHYHTGRMGFVSANGPVNFAFGRCHAVSIEARTRGYAAGFGPPIMGFLDTRQKRNPDAFVRLDPAIGPKLNVVGTMWTPGLLEALAQKCVKATGFVRQVRYAIVHVVTLWGFNNVWPDSGNARYRNIMATAVGLHNAFFLAPLLLMFVASFRRRFARHALLFVPLVALVFVAVIYFGDIRYRVPYDAVVIVLALDGWRRMFDFALSGAWRRWR